MQKNKEPIIVLSWRQFRAGQSGAGIASKLPAWDSDISSVPVPVEVGRFQDSLFGNPLVLFAISGPTMSSECMLSQFPEKT